MPVGSRRHDSALQPGALVVDFFVSLIDLIFFRRIRAIAGISIVSKPMSRSDRTQLVCLYQFGFLAAPGCQLLMAPKERKAPLILLFLRKSFAYLMGLGYSAQPWREQAKKLFPKGL